MLLLLRFFARLTLLGPSLWLATLGFADELPRTRWQILPLTELFYSDNGPGHVVTAAFDLPCGATPMGALLIDRDQKPDRKLQVAAVVARPLAGCARLPERRYFKMPFIDSTAYKLIEPMRGDLDGIRVTELNAIAVQAGSPESGARPELKVEIPCGVMAAGMLVTPDPDGGRSAGKSNAAMNFQLAGIGFRLPPRRVAEACGNSGRENIKSIPAPTQAMVRIGGLAHGGHYRVMPRKVSDLRKLGVLQLRAIDRLDLKSLQVQFKHRCYEVPVGVAVVPRGDGQALAVVVASYINAPCLARQATVSDSPMRPDFLPLELKVGRATGALAGNDLINPKTLRTSHLLTAAELKRFQLGQLLLAPGTRGDASGVVLATLKRGWFPFVVRSASNRGRFALQRAGINAESSLSSLSARYASGSRPLRLQITSAL